MAKPKMTALEYMQAANGGGPMGHSDPMTPGESGSDKPTQGDGATNGFASVNSQGGSKHGATTPASKAKGSGKDKKELSPNNTKKAGSMVKGKASFPGKNGKGDHRAAISRRLGGKTGPPPTGHPASRSGVLSKFEGFGKPQDSAPAQGN